MEIQYPLRFIIDENFIDWLLKDKDIAIDIISKLGYIHSKSKLYPLQHNLMLDSSFKEAIKSKKIRGQALLGAMHPEPTPNFLESENDFHCKLIRYAISIAAKKPYRVAILTSNVHLEKYIKNEHYNNDKILNAVKIFSEHDALNWIDVISKIKQ